MSGADHRGWLVARITAWALGSAAAGILVVPAVIDRNELRSQVETRWIEHANALGYTANATALAEQTQELRSMHEGLATRLPDLIDVEALRRELQAEATEAGLRIEALEIAPRELREFYGQWTVRLVAAGEARAAHAVLTRILQTPPLRRISAFSLERAKDGAAGPLRLELVFQAYDFNAP